MVQAAVRQADPISEQRLSESFFCELFGILNDIHFGSSLVECKVKWSDRIGIGKHCHKLFDFTVFEDKLFLPVIRLSKALLLEKSLERVAEVLFYAMTHIWLWQNKKTVGQTKEFYEKIKEYDFAVVQPKLRIVPCATV